MSWAIDINKWQSENRQAIIASLARPGASVVPTVAALHELVVVEVRTYDHGCANHRPAVDPCMRLISCSIGVAMV